MEQENILISYVDEYKIWSPYVIQIIHEHLPFRIKKIKLEGNHCSVENSTPIDLSVAFVPFDEELLKPLSMNWYKWPMVHLYIVRSGNEPLVHYVQLKEKLKGFIQTMEEKKQEFLIVAVDAPVSPASVSL